MSVQQDPVFLFEKQVIKVNAKKAENDSFYTVKKAIQTLVSLDKRLSKLM